MNQNDAAALSVWVALESPTSDPAGVNGMMDLVEKEVAGLPIAVERIPGRDGLGDMLLLRAGPDNGEPAVAVMSHLDTVHPLGTSAKGLPVRIEGDRLYGPGVYDMKGGAWLALQAFKQVAVAGTAGRPMVFLFTPDEEIGSPVSRGLIEEIGRKAKAVLVTEPARDGGRVVTARKGVGRFEVRVEGRPAHAGSRHADGRNAIREAAHQILAIEGMTDYARGITTSVALVGGGTAANVIPQHAWFSVDCRVTTLADGAMMEKRILGLKPHDPDVSLRITGRMNRPPYEKTPAVAELFALARKVAAEIGFELQDCPMTGGGSDGNFTAALGTPTLDGLGIDGDGAHTLQEYGLISSIAPRRALIKGLLEAL
ncbi:M20 family metallopeptidase [Bosea sp. (in: a-proteobacteria)]|uniref:M20 family metallopeptidase n=1 Tax=Bosea sp. (in: a-proteobacteria) TaxID=1871050 RepID=UPI00260A54A3|nr:M20 family metallopeptidase [Bosea sp. (in: a-proteobacteria)]MCO5092981.1 M20 family metallopeptidase [Bosea sp. (in: a-proteobacteria)]